MTRAQQKRRLEQGRARQRAFVAAGLRTDGKPRIGKKPCGCLHGCCLECRPKNHSGYYTDAEVQTFLKAYNSGLTQAAVERQFGLPVKGLKNVLQRRGFQLRPPTKVPRLGFGVRLPEPTEAEIQAAISKLRFVNVPPELKTQWKRWSMVKRQEFIQRIRATLQLKTDRPTATFSSNVTPWEYGTPEAMAIARKLNAGRTSQTKVVAIRASSQGVIWQGILWFWTAKHDGTPYGYQGGRPRRLLNRVIWEHTHGRPVPEKHIVSYQDGNMNNLAPENLQLISMADNARRNSVPARLQHDPHNPELLAKMKLRGERTSITRARNATRSARAGIAALLQNRSLAAAINQRR